MIRKIEKHSNQSFTDRFKQLFTRCPLDSTTRCPLECDMPMDLEKLQCGARIWGMQEHLSQPELYVAVPSIKFFTDDVMVIIVELMAEMFKFC